MRPLLLLPLLWAGSLARHLSYWLDVQGTVTVQEGLCVRVPCSFFHSWISWSAPVHSYWFREGANPSRDNLVATNNPAPKVQEETRGRFRLLRDPRNKSCSLDIRDAQTRDTGTYFFRVEGSPNVGHNYIGNKLSVRVTALTQTPDIRVQGPLESGRPGTITCAPPAACEWGTPPTFSWTWAALRSLGSQLPRSAVLTFTPGPRDHGTDLTCRVAFPGAGARVSSQSTIRPNVSYAPENLTVHVFRGKSTVPEILGNGTSLHVLEGQSLRLVCDAHGSSPTRLSWTGGSLTLSPSQPLDPGVLELPRLVLGDGGEFTCQAQHQSVSYRVSLNLVVQGVSSSCPCIPGEQQGTWPLILTLIRGALMGQVSFSPMASPGSTTPGSEVHEGLRAWR